MYNVITSQNLFKLSSENPLALVPSPSVDHSILEYKGGSMEPFPVNSQGIDRSERDAIPDLGNENLPTLMAIDTIMIDDMSSTLNPDPSTQHRLLYDRSFRIR